MVIHSDQFYVNPSSGLPIYRQVMDQVRSLISSGRMQPGSMLPSTRELAAVLEVNMMTISKAYSKLEADGVVERIRGKGMRVVDCQPAVSLTARKKEVAELLEPLLNRALQLGLSDEQIQAIVQRILKGKR